MLGTLSRRATLRYKEIVIIRNNGPGPYAAMIKPDANGPNIEAS